MLGVESKKVLRGKRSKRSGRDTLDHRRVEEPKVAISKDRGCTSLRHLLHVTPTLITAVVLGLNFTSVYFADLNFQNINTILKAFQFAAKFHEILLAASLSAIVLHRIRYELCNSGVPFECVTAEFQLSAVSYLLSSQFWSAAFAKRDVKAKFLLPLPLLILGAIFLTAVAGPSSAIALIPELEWWHFNEPFNKSQATVFIDVSQLNLTLYPPVVNAELVQSCAVGTSATGTCPNSSLADIQHWVSGFYDQRLAPNISLLNDGNTVRYLTATNDNLNGR